MRWPWFRHCLSLAPTLIHVFGVGLYRVTFKVEYSWKGAGLREFGDPELVVRSLEAENSCLSWGSFTTGKKYLVFANQAFNNALTVGAGSRTKLLENASEVSPYLRLSVSASLQPS